MDIKFIIRFILISLTIPTMFKCQDMSSNIINKPIALPIIKTNSYNVKRIMINTISFGDVICNTPLLIDTGSSGITINIKYILPKELYNDQGVIMNDDSLSYKGITFTNEKTTVSYGGNGVKTTQYGQLAYAEIKIGDEKNNITTLKMPFIAYYLIEKNGEKIDEGFNPGIFGINPKAVQFNGKMKPIFDFLTFEGLNSGFLLNQLGTNWNNCDPKLNNCLFENLLIIGITDEMKKNFTETKLEKISDNIYKSAIPAIIKDNNKKEKINVMFDTGNSSFGEIVPEINTNDLLTLSVGDTFNWSFKVPKKDKINFIGNKNPINRSIIGIDFFEKHSLFYDFSEGTLGIK